MELYRAWEQPVLFGDAEETLRRLRPRKLGIVTNGSERSQGAKIVNSGLDRLTDAVAISGALGVRKPESAIFEDICRRLDVAPARCAMVGDRPGHDVGGGLAAGMRTIWIERAPWPAGLVRAAVRLSTHVRVRVNGPVAAIASPCARVDQIVPFEGLLAGPAGRHDFRLFKHRSGGALLLVRRIAVLAQDALDEAAEVGAHVLA